MSVTPAVTVTQLTKTFRSPFSTNCTTALERVSLTIARGETVALLGPNGSGKSTLLHILLGLLTPTSGTAELFGISVHRSTARQKIGFVPERPSFEAFLSIQETLHFYGTLAGLSKKKLSQKSEELLSLLELNEAASKLVRDASQGTLQRLALAQALLHDPELLILDEPTTGLDPVALRFFSQLLLQLHNKGKTILLTSHLLTHVEETCTQMVLLQKGKLIFSGAVETSHSLPATTALEDFYLELIKKNK